MIYVSRHPYHSLKKMKGIYACMFSYFLIMSFFSSLHVSYHMYLAKPMWPTWPLFALALKNLCATCGVLCQSISLYLALLALWLWRCSCVCRCWSKPCYLCQWQLYTPSWSSSPIFGSLSAMTSELGKKFLVLRYIFTFHLHLTDLSL